MSDNPQAAKPSEQVQKPAISRPTLPTMPPSQGGPPCGICGGPAMRAGACWVCMNCGTPSSCS